MKEKVQTAETELNELRAWKETQVKKVAMTKKAQEESKSLADELRKVGQGGGDFHIKGASPLG